MILLFMLICIAIIACLLMTGRFGVAKIMKGKRSREGKNEINVNTSEKEIDVNRTILTSALGILICFILLCGTTYAWFEGTVSCRENTIFSSEYEISTELNHMVVEESVSETDEKIITESYLVNHSSAAACNQLIDLSGLSSVVLHLKASGTSTKGYSKITAFYSDNTSEVFYSSSLVPGETIDLTVNPDVVSILIEYSWGEAGASNMGPATSIHVGTMNTDSIHLGTTEVDKPKEEETPKNSED